MVAMHASAVFICIGQCCFCLQRIAEHDYLKAEEVEGANDFLRATRQEHETLRRRGPSHQAFTAAKPGTTSEAV